MNKLEHRIILVDQDDVVTDFSGGFSTTWKKTYPNLLYIPLEQRKHYKMRDDYPPELHPLINEIYCRKGFYLNLPPMPGAIEALNTMRDIGLKVVICTSPPADLSHWELEKRAWINKYLGPGWEMIATSDKTEVKGDYLIDDNPSVKGKFTPSWEHIIFDQPYNAHIPGKRIKRDWSNWKDVLR